MTDIMIKDLPNLVTASPTDIIPIVHDPTGANATSKIQLTNLAFAYSGGKSGGQIIYGGTLAGEGLALGSTSNATKGYIYFGSGSNFDESRQTWNILNTWSGYLPLGGWNIKLNANVGVLTETTAVWNLYMNSEITDTGHLNEHVPIGNYIGYAGVAPAALSNAAGIYGQDTQVYKGANVPDNNMVGISITMYKVPALTGAHACDGLFIAAPTTGAIPGTLYVPSGCTRAGDAIYVTGNAGWTNLIKYIDVDNLTTLFQVDQTGLIYGTALRVFGTPGAGVASTITFTNQTDATVTNAYVVKGGQALNTVNTGWIKIYFGTYAAWIPVWANATP